MIQTYALSEAVTLRYCPDSRFKKSAMSLQLLRPMCLEESALNALLPSVLLRGTRTLPDLQAITQYLDDCYGASMGALVRRCGDIQTVGFYLSFPDDRYALSGEPIFEPVLELLRQTLLEPVLEEGAFCREFVESEKRNLIATIESERNDKRAYAAARLMRTLCRGDSFAVPRLGEVATVEAITPQRLYRHYERILRHSAAEIFYIGAAPAGTVIRLLQPIVAALAPKAPRPQHTPFLAPQPGEEVEEQPVQQSKLCMGIVTDVTYSHPLHAAMAVLNHIYGGGMTGKLFTHVRERLGLCYYAGSAYYGSKGLITVSAGIDAGAYDRAREEILTQLEHCRSGNITPEELAAAKSAILSSLDSTPDSPSAMEGYYGSAFISGFDRELEHYRAAVEAVSLADVVEAAGTCRLHTVYLLKGTA